MSKLFLNILPHEIHENMFFKRYKQGEGLPMAHLPVHGVILFIAKHWQTNTICNIHLQVFTRDLKG